MSDRIALRHGKRLDMAEMNPPTYRFVREELGVLVDFLGDTLLEGGNHRTLKIIEHPDVFIRDGRLIVDFDPIIEIRHNVEDVICTEDISMSFTAFDLS